MSINFEYDNKSFVLKEDLVLEVDGTTIPIFESSNIGKWFSWNKRMVPLGQAIMFFYKKMLLPEKHWKKIKPVFVNKNTGDFSPNNLVPFYLEKIPCEIDGFFYVPGLELNAVNVSGVVWQVDKRRFRSPRFPTLNISTHSHNNYPFTRCDVQDGRNNRISTHRLTGLVFSNPPENYYELHVDHKNGNCWDFTPDNLQWVTPKENTLKGYYQDGNDKQCVPVLILNIKTGEVTEYPSLSVASSSLGIGPKLLDYFFKRPDQTKKDHFTVKRKDDLRAFEEIQGVEPKEISKIESKHIVTGEVKEWDTLTSFIRKMGGGYGSALASLRGEKFSIISNHILRNVGEDWPEPTEYQIQIHLKGLQPSTKVYKITDLVEGTVTVLYGTGEVQKMIPQINKRTISVLSKISGVYSRRYRIEILN